MGKVYVDITTSVDGFVAGPNPSLEHPLGEGGERLHEWLVGTASFKERHGESGGEVNADSELFEESFLELGAVVMGRRMFSGGEGPWETILARTAGGETSRRSTPRSSSSPTTRGRQS